MTTERVCVSCHASLRVSDGTVVFTGTCARQEKAVEMPCLIHTDDQSEEEE